MDFDRYTVVLLVTPDDRRGSRRRRPTGSRTRT
jgi:hypothetical protein